MLFGSEDTVLSQYKDVEESERRIKAGLKIISNEYANIIALLAHHCKPDKYYPYETAYLQQLDKQISKRIILNNHAYAMDFLLDIIEDNLTVKESKVREEISKMKCDGSVWTQITQEDANKLDLYEKGHDCRCTYISKLNGNLALWYGLTDTVTFSIRPYEFENIPDNGADYGVNRNNLIVIENKN